MTKPAVRDAQGRWTPKCRPPRAVVVDGRPALEIELTHGKVALIDVEDAHLAAFAWHAICEDNGWWYAARHEPRPSKRILRLHREVLGVTDPRVYVDHGNSDGLDCRRSNLRAATNTQNQHNRVLARSNTSGFKGVSLLRQTGKWQAAIKANGRKLYLGQFARPEDAARAYDDAARANHGEFARLNFPRENERAA
jgi:hypothetical protein